MSTLPWLVNFRVRSSPSRHKNMIIMLVKAKIISDAERKLVRLQLWKFSFHSPKIIFVLICSLKRSRINQGTSTFYHRNRNSPDVYLNFPNTGARIFHQESWPRFQKRAGHNHQRGKFSLIFSFLASLIGVGPHERKTNLQLRKFPK